MHPRPTPHTAWEVRPQTCRELSRSAACSDLRWPRASVPIEIDEGPGRLRKMWPEILSLRARFRTNPSHSRLAVYHSAKQSHRTPAHAPDAVDERPTKSED